MKDFEQRFAELAEHKRFNRRRLFKATAGGVIAAGPLGALLAACGGGGSGGSEKLTRPLAMHHDAAVGPLFEPYVKYFNENYAPLKLETSYVAQDYFGATNQQLAGGSVDYDVLFADEGYLDSWAQNGWIRKIDDFPKTSDLFANMQPGVEDNLRDEDGTLVALPYFRGTEIFVYNQEHLGKVGAKPPATWEEFVDVARELKSKGIANTPYSPYWIKYAFLIWHQLAAEVASDGAGPLFGDTSSPDFADDPVVHSTLKRWQTMYDEGLVPKDVFTTDYGGITNIFAGGKSSFSMRYQAQVVGWKDPKQSRVAEAITNMLIPGQTHQTHSFGAYWFMAASTPEPDKAWTLMNYLGGAGKDDDYYVPKNLIDIGLGLSSGYAPVDDDPAVTDAWAKWADVDTLKEQLGNAVSLGPTVNKSWYPKFAETASGTLQEIALGKKSVEGGLKELADFVKSQ